MSQIPRLSDTAAYRRAQLQRFSRQVANLQALNEGGKLGEDTCYLMMRKLWHELQQLQPAATPRRIARPDA